VWEICAACGANVFLAPSGGRARDIVSGSRPSCNKFITCWIEFTELFNFAMNFGPGRAFFPSDTGFENTVATAGFASQDIAVKALVCFSAVVGTMCLSVVVSLIHFIRSLVWGCGRDQSFDARVWCIRLQLRCEHPWPSIRKLMQYCDHGPVWFGNLGVGANPTSMEGLLRSLHRLLGDSTTWTAGR
jgi:hypothetical protein